ncbi:hypothetical protein Tco_0432262 [Tanacetum coccineum]
MIQHEFITLTLAQFGQILRIPYNGQAVFTNAWYLASLAYFQETGGPYHTDLPTPDDIRQFLQLDRVELNRTIKSQNVTLNPNQILTKELRQDMKRWEELIRENCFGQENKITSYLFVKRIECARATSTANFTYGMSLTVSIQHPAPQNYGSSSHQGDDDEDDGASRASTPSPTTYLNSLQPLNYQ